MGVRRVDGRRGDGDETLEIFCQSKREFLKASPSVLMLIRTFFSILYSLRRTPIKIGSLLLSSLRPPSESNQRCSRPAQEVERYRMRTEAAATRVIQEVLRDL